MIPSTIHDDSFITKKRQSRTAPDGQEDILKRVVVGEYKNMEGIDTSDQLYYVLRIFPPYSQVVEAAVFSPHRPGDHKCIYSIFDVTM